MFDSSAVDQRRAATLLRTIVEEQARGLHSSPIVGLRHFFEFV
jgi:hypothetical protein